MGKDDAVNPRNLAGAYLEHVNFARAHKLKFATFAQWLDWRTTYFMVCERNFQ